MVKAFNVYLRGALVDTVFYSASDPVTPEEVRRSLVNHDGYHPSIVVLQETEQEKGKVK